MRSWLAFLGLLASAVVLAVVFRPEPLAPGAAFEPEDTIPGPVEPSDWFYRQRAFPTGRIDQAAFVAAQQRASEMRAAKAGGPAWQFAGPTNIGGRVSALAVESFDVFYAGTGSGGVFKTTDGGTTFTPVGDEVFTLSIGDVALDPQDPQTVWVGTGEANGGGGSLTYGGSGLWRSRDGGATWEARGLSASGTVGRIAVHPTDSDRVWVAVAGALFTKDDARGVFRTTDGGGSWTRTLAVDDSTGAIDLAVNPRSPDTLYAATWTRQRRPDARRYGGPGSGLWRSADGGATWQRLTSGLPGGADVGRIGVALAPSRPNVVYTVFTDATGNTRGTYRSTNGGDSWTPLASADDVSYGWWFGQIRVDPTDWETVWTPWLDLYRSTNGGGSWSYRSGSMHVDHHALWIDPADPSRMIAGNDGGVYRSANAGANWAKASGGLPATQFYTVEVDASRPERLYGGAQDNGTNRTLTGGLGDWQQIFGGDGHYVLVDPSDNAFVYVEYQYGNLFRSTNGGSSFVSARPPVLRANWSAPLAFDPRDPRTLYFGGARLWRSTDRAQSWAPISPDLSDGPRSGNLVFGTLTTIGVSPAAPGRLWAGTDDGHVWTTADGGATWADVSAGLPTRWVTRVTPHPTAPLTAVATLSGFRSGEDAARVYRTDDAGATWTAIDAGLPDAPANDVLFDPADPDRLFLGTDVGTFWSRDGGATWDVLGSDLPLAPVTDLDLEGRSLVAATYGRGLHRLDLARLPTSGEAPPGAALALSLAPNPASGATVLRFSLSAPGRASAEVFDARGRSVLVSPAAPFGAGEGRLRLDLARLPPGVYTVRLTTPEARESTRLTVVR